MNVVDSSAWLEYLAGGPNAEAFSGAVEDIDALLVPTITIFEVFKRVSARRGPDEALQTVALMLQGEVMELDADLAVTAADLSLEEGLPMADSIFLASARSRDAVLWTQDADFEDMPGVEYRSARR